MKTRCSQSRVLAFPLSWLANALLCLGCGATKDDAQKDVAVTKLTAAVSCRSNWCPSRLLPAWKVWNINCKHIWSIFFTQNCWIISTFNCHFCLRCTTPDAHCYRKFGSQTACRALVKRKNREKKSGLFPQPRLQRRCQTTSIREAVLSVIWGDSSPHSTAPWGLIRSQGNAPPKKPWAGRQLNKDSVWGPVTADNKKRTDRRRATGTAQTQVVTVHNWRQVEDL